MSAIADALPVDPAAFEYVCRLVMDRSGICLGPDKQYLVHLRITPVARAAGFPDLNEYLARLRQYPSGPQHTAVVEAMTTNETSFFRDIAPFEALRQQVLPELIRARGPQGRLRIWCAASSTGQEPYSLAMMIRHHFPQCCDRVEILATDIAQSVLAVARAGRFSQFEVNRGLPAPMLVKYFTQEGAEWQIEESIRRMVDFRPLNLITDWPQMQPFDIVLIRNVMIYFNQDAKKSILQKIRRVLNRDGYLFLGTSETTMGLDDTYHRTTCGKAVCYQPQKPPAAPAGPAGRPVRAAA